MRNLCTLVILLSDGVKNVLNRSFLYINSLIPRVFALPESKIPARAKGSMNGFFFRPLSLFFLLFLQINANADELGLSVQQVETLLAKEREKILFVDVRDPVEIMFVGFTDEVDVNIPYLLVDRTTWDVEKNRFVLFQNPSFTEDVGAMLREKRLDRNAIIITMCRSGSERGKPSADYLRNNGFPNAKYLVHGFQGSALKEGPQKGFRIQNGWQNSGLPWQAKPNPEKIYRKQL